MKKETIKNIIKCVAFMGIFCGIMALLCIVFMPKTSDPDGGLSNPNARGFYGEPKNSLDVVVLGNSNAYSAYSPMVMWKKYGIPSYVAAEGAQNIAETTNVLKELLTCQKPKLVILDVDCLWQGKTQVDRVEGNVKSIIYRNIPLMKYHDRWKGLTLKDSFKSKRYTYRSETKGQYLSKKRVAYTGENKMVETDAVEPVPKSSRIFLSYFLKICKENDIDVLFVEMPSANSWNYKKHNGMMQYAEKLGIPFLDLNTTEGKNAIDWSKDSRDGGKHLNSYGARKVTREIGAYLSENYSFVNKKKDPSYDDWNSAYKSYKAYMKKSSKKHSKESSEKTGTETKDSDSKTTTEKSKGNTD